MAETREGMAKFLVALAGDLRDGKPIAGVIDEMEEAVEEWREEFPED